MRVIEDNERQSSQCSKAAPTILRTKKNMRLYLRATLSSRHACSSSLDDVPGEVCAASETVPLGTGR